MFFAVEDARICYKFYSDMSEVKLELWDKETKLMLASVAVPFAVWERINTLRETFMREHMDQIEITDNQLGYLPFVDIVASDSGYSTTHGKHTYFRFLQKKVYN